MTALVSLALATSSIVLPAGSGAGFVAVGDVNGDRRPDLIIANHDEETVTVLLNDGGRRFHAANGSPFAAGPQPNDVAVADMNGDGHADLIIANHQSPFITVLLGDGTGAFTPAPGSPYATGSYPHPHGVAVADFTGDGRLDVAVDSWGNNRVALIEGDGTGRLVGTRQMFPVGRRPYERLRSGDFDHDGHADLVTTNLDDGTVTILLGDGSGAFRNANGSPFVAGAAPWQVAVGDLDGDGYPDLAVIPYDRDVHDPANVVVSVLRNDGSGQFHMDSRLRLDGCTGPNAVAIGDVNGDGRQDVAVACATSATLTLFIADAKGGYARQTIGIGSAPTWGGVALADLDDDGRADIIVSNSREGVVRILSSPR
jgi:hypothetical protein